MNPITIGVGLLICGYALWVLTLRLQGKEDKFHKLEPMRKFWGPQLGSAIHYIGYVGLPLIFGIIAILGGMRGLNLLAVFER